MIGLKKVDDTWIVCKFVEGHNHELLTPKSTSLLRGHRVITIAQKNLIDTLNESLHASATADLLSSISHSPLVDSFLLSLEPYSS